MENFLKIISQKEVYGLLLILGFAYILFKLVTLLIQKVIIKEKSEIERKRKATITALFKNCIKYIILIIAIITILDLYGVNVNSLIASLGVFSAVSALALQDTLKDIIGGASIIIDNFYVVGDYITINGFTGQVIQIGLRTTKIMNVDKKVLTISNRNIGEVVNLSEKKASFLVEVPTAYEEKTENVEKIIKKIIDEVKTWPTVDKEKTCYIGVTELADSSVKYGIRCYCSTANSWQYERDLLRLIKITYDKYNIKIPYNQLEVHNGK